MLKDTVDSFKDNIKERFTNPFLGTFALVWIVKNWQIVYAFFSFDKEWKLEQKIKYFNDYWINHSFIINLLIVASISLGILVVTYLFLAVSRYLTSLFENVIIPYITKITKGKIVTKEVYQNTLDKNEYLLKKLEEEKKARNEAVKERDEIDERYSKLILLPQVSTLNSNEDAESFKLNNVKQDETIEFQRILSIILNEKLTQKIEEVLLDISKEFDFDFENEYIDFLLKNLLITLSKKNESDYKRNYSFTEKGKNFFIYFFENRLN